MEYYIYLAPFLVAKENGDSGVAREVFQSLHQEREGWFKIHAVCSKDEVRERDVVRERIAPSESRKIMV